METAAFPHGVITANLTPLQENLKVHRELLVEHCEYLLHHGSDGLAVLGTTGEAQSFSVEERKEIVEMLADIDRDQIMLGVGCCSYVETQELIEHAVDHGISRFLVLPPFYYKAVDDEGLFQYFDQLINGVGSHSIKMFLYHFPKLAGVSFSMPLVERLVSSFPDTIVGMKDSTGDWPHMKEVLDAVPGFNLYAGTERYLIEALKHGGCGCISATANVTCTLAAQALRAWSSSGDESVQRHLIEVRSAFEGLPFTGALKAILAYQYGNRNWLNVRPPNRILEGQPLDHLIANLKKATFL